MPMSARLECKARQFMLITTHLQFKKTVEMMGESFFSGRKYIDREYDNHDEQSAEFPGIFYPWFCSLHGLNQVFSIMFFIPIHNSMLSEQEYYGIGKVDKYGGVFQSYFCFPGIS